MSEHVEMVRARSRRILDQLSVGERFMLMLGRGEVKRDPLRVEWKEPFQSEPQGGDTETSRILIDESRSKESFV
jgi:hypothetical protein